jgi:hypothetical protein
MTLKANFFVRSFNSSEFNVFLPFNLKSEIFSLKCNGSLRSRRFHELAVVVNRRESEEVRSCS